MMKSWSKLRKTAVVLGVLACSAVYFVSLCARPIAVPVCQRPEIIILNYLTSVAVVITIARPCVSKSA